MNIFLNSYLITYSFTLIYLQIFLTNFLTINYSIKNINYLITYIIKYSKFKNIILLLLISLSGLPPFYLFIVKFNILIFLLQKLNIIYILLIFIIFYINMLYYVQIFVFKNVNYHLTISNIKINKINNKYVYTYSLIFFLIILCSGFLISKDVYWLSNLL